MTPKRSSGRFTTVLDALQQNDGVGVDHHADPGAAFRFVYDHWVERGGYERGKPRHSVRQIKEWLGTRHAVRSLETKLAGKTRLQWDDAVSLLRLMLGRWIYDETAHTYSPFAKRGLDALVEDLVNDLFPQGANSVLLPERNRRSSATAKATDDQVPAQELTRPAGDVIRQHFQDSDVLITVSRVRTIIGADPPAAMTAFHRLMDSLYQIDQKDDRQRSLIWIVDLGLRNDKTAARGAIYNLFFLMAQFRSIALIETEGEHQLYRWLQGSCCIILGSLDRDEIDQIYEEDKVKFSDKQAYLRWFQADRLFLESVPGRWLDAPGSEAFRRSQKELWRTPTITAHLRKEEWDDLDHSSEIDIRRNLRYYYHGEVTYPSLRTPNSEIRCIPLEEPGSRWSDVYRLAVQAALGRLGHQWDESVSLVKPLDAIAQLREAGFAVLTLDGLLHLPEILITSKLEDSR